MLSVHLLNQKKLCMESQQWTFTVAYKQYTPVAQPTVATAGLPYILM